QRRIGECHQHAAVDYAARIDVTLIDGKGECLFAGRAFLEHRTDEDLERIDQLRLGEPGERHASRIFHNPVATARVRSPATSSAERNAIDRVRRVTRPRASITSPSLPGPTKSQLSETVLQLFAPMSRR